MTTYSKFVGIRLTPDQKSALDTYQKAKGLSSLNDALRQAIADAVEAAGMGRVDVVAAPAPGKRSRARLLDRGPYPGDYSAGVVVCREGSTT